MKAKVIIENRETTIILTPENEFEKDIIEKVHNKKKEHNTLCTFDLKESYGNITNHKIEILINQID